MVIQHGIRAKCLRVVENLITLSKNKNIYKHQKRVQKMMNKKDTCKNENGHTCKREY